MHDISHTLQTLTIHTVSTLCPTCRIPSRRAHMHDTSHPVTRLGHRVLTVSSVRVCNKRVTVCDVSPFILTVSAL